MQPRPSRKKVFYKEWIPDEPDHFDLLTRDDQLKYKDLQAELVQLCIKRSKKNCKVQDLEEWMQKIKDFCIRGDSGDKNRCFVCGIFWIEYGIALNIEHLQILVRKCRSSLNTTLRTMGYELTEGRCDANSFFKQIIPDIGLSRHEERLWSFRSNSKTCDINTVKNKVSYFRSSQNLSKRVRIKEIKTNDEKTDPPFEFDDILFTDGNFLDENNTAFNDNSIFENFFDEMKNQIFPDDNMKI